MYLPKRLKAPSVAVWPSALLSLPDGEYVEHISLLIKWALAIVEMMSFWIPPQSDNAWWIGIPSDHNKNEGLVSL